MALAHDVHAGGPSRAASSVDQFIRDGYAIFEGALDDALVAELRTEYLDALRAKQHRLGINRVEYERERVDRYGRPIFIPLGGNHDVNRWNMHLPSRMPFLHPDVITHPRAMEIMDAVMGDDCVLTMLASDAAAPGSQLQEIHQDSHVTRLVVNIPLIDFTDDNGPIEMWPGTHRRDPFAPADRFEFDTPPLPNDRIKELVEKIPVKRGVMRAGSILVRDQRLLHRGSENTSTVIRPMLSLLYFADAPELPYCGVADLAANAALRARQLLRKVPGSPRQASALSRANAAGRIVEFAARSDRDYRRVISTETWNQLPPRAQRLLRYAHVEGRPPVPVKRSARATYAMVRTAFKGMSAAIGGQRAPSDRQ
jgi:ectoine hydroxylase-related dioxygenase (phytanoyl-CoA dioxygenase family)